MKTSVLESLFNKAAGPKVRNLVEKRLHRCFPVKLARFLRTASFTEHLPVTATSAVFAAK